MKKQDRNPKPSQKHSPKSKIRHSHLTMKSIQFFCALITAGFLTFHSCNFNTSEVKEGDPKTPKRTSEDEKSSPKKAVYDYIGPLKEGLRKARNEASLWGFLDKKRKPVIPFIFDWASHFSEGRAAVELDGKWGFIAKNGERVVPLEYDWVDNFKKGYAIVQKKGLEGLINREGAIVIPIKYDFVDSFQDSLCIVKKYLPSKEKDLITDGQNNLIQYWALVNQKGQQITPLKYHFIAPFEGKVARAMLLKVDENGFAQKRLGLLDRRGKEMAPLVYQYIGGFKDGLAVFYRKKENYWGYINQDGKEINQFPYSQVDDFSDGLGRVEANHQFGFVDQQGQEVIKPKFDYASSFKNGFSLIAIKGKYGVLSIRGALAIPPRYEDIKRQKNSLVKTHDGKKYEQALLSARGDLLIAPGTYDSIQHIIGGIYQIRKDHKVGYYNRNLESLFLPIEYDSIIYIRSQVFQVQYDGKWGLVNRQNEVIVPIIYNKLNFQETGLVRAISKSLDNYLVGDEGKVLVEPDAYQEVNDFKEGLARVRKNGKYGYINQKGNLTIPIKYTQATDFYQGKARVIQGEKIKIIDQSGKSLNPSNTKKDVQLP